MKIQNSKFKIQNSYSNSGFTLIEILIASYIFVIVIITATAIFSSAVGAKMKATALWQNQQEARLTMEKISRTIRDTKTKGFRVLDNTGQVSASGAGPELRLCQGENCDPLPEYPKFRLENDSILMQDFKGNLIQLTSPDKVKADNLRFEGYFPTENSKNQPYIKITFSVSSLPGKVTETDTLFLTTTINLRNYAYKYNDTNAPSPGGCSTCSWIVERAGDPSYDGCYCENGTFNGKPYYENANGRFLFWAMTELGPPMVWKWRLDDDKSNENDDALYAYFGTGPDLDANPWNTWQDFDPDMRPAPTVRRAP